MKFQTIYVVVVASTGDLFSYMVSLSFFDLNA